MPRREGAFLVEDFYLNTGGLNTADSPFVVPSDCAAGGMNFDYIKRGGIQKRDGHTKLNSVADTELKTLGLGLWDKASTANRAVIRAADRKLQTFDTTSFAFTNLSEDTTAAGTDFGAASSTQPVVFSMYNSASAGVLWSAGGGATSLYGVYSTTKVTQNGVPEVTASSFTATGAGAGSGITLAAGTYRYTLVYRKASTQALGNASTSLEASATVAGTEDSVDLAWTLTNNDTAKYDKIYIYRSSVGGATAFTAGALVAIVNSSATTYSDTGADSSSSENVPRANSTVLDNSQLASGAYKTLTLFKRRLVTAVGSTIKFSDINKPESWPTYQTITIPSGGDITGLAIISRTAAGSDSIDEILCVFKQSELWIVTGDGVIDDAGLPDWALKFIDNSGCSNQPLIVSADGKLAWVNYRGVFMWDGNGKPRYISQPIENKFQRSGDIDKSKLSIGWGRFVQRRNEIQWCLSSSAEGEQVYVIKLDLRLTEEKGRGIFTPDVSGVALYAGLAFLSAPDATEELLYLGDGAGFIYSGYSGTAEAGADLEFEYITPYLNLGNPSGAKRINKVVVWVLDAGPYNLDLTFWSDYRYKPNDGSTVTLPVSAALQVAGAKWGSFDWGTGVWGDNADKIKALVFNLNSVKNNLEGDAFRLKLSQTGDSETVVIYGFSVFYTELPSRK